VNLYTPIQIAKIYGITSKRVKAIAIARGVGQKIGSRGDWVFRESDIKKLEPGKIGRPRKP
jgi:hypothetical protein